MGGGGHFEKAQRILKPIPLIHPSFQRCESELFQPIDVETTNILAANSAKVHHISLQTSVVKIAVHYLRLLHSTSIYCFGLLS